MNDLRDFKTRLENIRKPKPLSNATQDAYFTAAKEFLTQVKNPSELTRQHIDNYIKYLDSDSLKYNTKLLKIAGIKAFLKFKDQIDLKEYIREFKFERKEGDVKEVDYRTIRTQIEALRKSDKFKNDRDKLIFFLLAEAGLRVSELLNLSLKNFNLDSKRLSLWQQKQKNKASAEITTNIKNALEDYLKHYEVKDKLFDISRQKVDTILKSYFSEFSAHKLRHFYITAWAKTGMPRKMLKLKSRHKSDATLDLYTDIDEEDIDSYFKEHKLKKPF